MATIKEIKELLVTVKELESPIFLELEKDNRSGVQKEISKRKRAIQAELDENLRLESMLSYEKELYKQGLTLIAGIDEVGRGPLAGPVVAAAVILPKNCKIKGLNDSKKIPKKKHVVEEVYHHFSRFFWVSTLAASIVANFVSLLMFGLTPVLDMPDNIPPMTLDQYWIYLVMGIFLGFSGFLYEKAVLNVGRVYDLIGQKIHLDRAYYPILAFILIIPVGIFLPQIIGGGNQLVLSLTEQNFSFQVLLAYFLIRFIWSMISYGSGLPGGIFLPILALGSLLGALVGVICVNLGLVSQEQFPIFVILGMSGYFGAISKAPLTAMILVTEMVGDIRNLMPLGLVTLVSYIIMDLLKGTPVYEAMLEKMLPEEVSSEGEVTLIEIPVSDKIAGKQVHELNLPHNVLITTQVHNGKSQTVNGSTRMYLGDMIHLVIPKSEIGKVKDLLL